jgi:GTPase
VIKGVVAIVGRPNVGKSTLFNRMTRSEKAIVDDKPGVTRDRLYGLCKVEEDGFTLIDTGGFETDDFNYQPFKENLVWRQTSAAIDEADLVIMVLDGKEGLQPWDEEISRILHRKRKRVIYVVNKVDGIEQKAVTLEFYSLGIEGYHCISAAHNRGVGELKEMIQENLNELHLANVSKNYDMEGKLKLAVIGRPNVGKSSIVNRLTGDQTSLVSDIAGTTRDTVDTPVTYNSKDYILLDTAGIRRRSKVEEKIESLSVMRSIQALDNADVVILVIDAKEGFTDQDAKLAALTVDRHKPLLVVVNKWDLLEEKDANSARDYERNLKHAFKTLGHAPFLFTSCLMNQRIHKIMLLVEELAEQYQRRVETARLNEALEAMIFNHTPALIRARKKRVKFYYATQVRSSPPTIVVKCNLADELQESYKRYMHRAFQKALGFDKIPIRLLIRGKESERKEAKEAKARAAR